MSTEPSSEMFSNFSQRVRAFAQQVVERFENDAWVRVEGDPPLAEQINGWLALEGAANVLTCAPSLQKSVAVEKRGDVLMRWTQYSALVVYCERTAWLEWNKLLLKGSWESILSPKDRDALAEKIGPVQPNTATATIGPARPPVGMNPFAVMGASGDVLNDPSKGVS